MVLLHADRSWLFSWLQNYIAVPLVYIRPSWHVLCSRPPRTRPPWRMRPCWNPYLTSAIWWVGGRAGGRAAGRAGGRALPGPHACPQYPLRVHQCPDAPLLTCWFALLPVRSTMASCCVRFLAASACWRRASASRTCRLVLPRFHPLLACFVVSTLLRVCSDVDAALLLGCGRRLSWTSFKITACPWRS